MTQTLDGQRPRRAPALVAPAEKVTRWRLARWLVAAVVLAGVNLVWNWRGAVAPVAPTPRLAQGPLRISEVRSHVTSDGTALAVEVRVRNTATRRHKGRVWWQLAPATRSGAVWERRAYESAFTEVDLPADTDTTLEWQETFAVRDGRYEVHAWAQVHRKGAFRPSDGAVSDPPVVTVSAGHELLRHRPVPSDVEIVEVQASADDGYGFTGEVTLHNSGATARRGRIRWMLRRGPADVVSWWRRPWRAPLYQEFTIEGQSDAVVRLRPRRPLAPGSYALRLTLAFDASTAGVQGEGDDILVVVDVGDA